MCTSPRSHREGFLRSVCLHVPSDDIHLYVYAPLRQGLATVCFHWMVISGQCVMFVCTYPQMTYM